MYSWLHADLELKEGGTAGHGIFATSAIPAGTRLVVFGGHVISLHDEERLPESISDYAHQIADDLVIGITRPEDVQVVDHINHSCNPNAGFKGQIFLVAMQDIAEGEEVTFDYAMVLAEAPGVEPYVLDCMCQKHDCRKKITDSDWRDKTLQSRYRGFFQYYIEEKIAKLDQQSV